MSGSTIGIKIADGSYYPILEQGFTGRKKLTLTTVGDSQNRVQIDLYRGDGGGLEKARYIGSLIIENIPPARRGEPEIHLSIGLDADGELDAEASDESTGETQKFAISLKTLSDEETYEIPEFRVEEELQPLESEGTGEIEGPTRKPKSPRKPKRLKRSRPRQSSKGWMPSPHPGSPRSSRSSRSSRGGIPGIPGRHGAS